MVQDLRLALRRLRQSPAFTLAAVLTLALGIGANTSVFSLINTVLFRPLPVEHPGELVFLENTSAGGFPTHSYPDYQALRDRNSTLTALLAFKFVPANLSRGQTAERAWGYLASGNYFQTLGVQAALGRTFTPAEDRIPLGHPVIVLSEGCWRRRFGADPALVGGKIKLNGLDYTVLGIMPPGFGGTELFFAAEFWVPMMQQPQVGAEDSWLDRRATRNLMLLGRLRPGVTRRRVQEDLNAIAAQLGREFPENCAGMRIDISEPGLAGSIVRRPLTGFAGVLMAVAALVLLLTCANLSGLLLSRASDRRKETSIRLALGARRGRLVRQWLTETLVLAFGGGAAGILLSVWVADAFAQFRLPTDFPLLIPLAVDGRVFAFAFAVAAASALLFGLAPALDATRVDLVPALKGGPGAPRRRPLRDLLVGAQVALSVMLLAGSLLMLRSLHALVRMPFGFEPHGAVSATVDLSLQGYDHERGRDFYRVLLERVRALPGVESAALASSLPLDGAHSYKSVFADGGPEPRAGDMPQARWFEVTPDYFHTMRTRLVAGREFDAGDHRDAPPVAVINSALAARLFGAADPVGRRIRISRRSPALTVAGVAETGPYSTPGERPGIAVWVPSAQDYNGDMRVVARSSLPPGATLAAMRRVIRELDPALPVLQPGSLEEHLGLALFPARVAAVALGAFGLLAVILAATGVYGVVAYAVGRRTREIGIRIAIGATRTAVLRLVLRRIALVGMAGAAAGAMGAFALGSLYGRLLYRVNPRDPLTVALAMALMAAVALAACVVPARRALSIDPANALRDE